MTVKAQAASVLCVVFFSCGTDSSPSGRAAIDAAVDTGAEDAVDAGLVDTLEDGSVVDTLLDGSTVDTLEDGSTVDTLEDGSVVDTPGDEAGDGASSEDAPSQDAPSIVSKDLCARMCDVLALVDCPNQRAPAACTEKCFEDGMICTSEHEAYFECIVATGPTAFDCDPDFAILVLKPGSCAPEGDALVGCLANEP
jgi:hypothetical protein